MAIRYLEQEEQRAFNDEFDKISYNIHSYGNPNDKLIGRPCLRVKNIDKVTVNNKRYTKYTIGFMKHHKYNPKLETNNPDFLREISHSCGNPKNTIQSLCIEGSHMRLETHIYNLERHNCHEYIRKFQKANFKKQNIQTKGTLTIDIINREKQKLNEKSVPRCQHYPVCFINYGKRPAGSHRLSKNRS